MTERKLRSKFEFVVVAAARAKQLMRGATPRVEGPSKPTKVAQAEVRRGKVRKVEDEK